MKMMSRNIFLVVVKVIHVRRTLSVLDWVHLVPLFFVMFNFCLILSLLRKTSEEHFWVQMWIRRKDEDFSRFLFLVVTYRHLRVYAGLSNKNVLFYVIITSHESSACQMSEVRITVECPKTFWKRTSSSFFLLTIDIRSCSSQWIWDHHVFTPGNSKQTQYLLCPVITEFFQQLVGESVMLKHAM